MAQGEAWMLVLLVQSSKQLSEKPDELQLLPWRTLGLASPETGKACRERLVGFVQFDLKLS